MKCERTSSLKSAWFLVNLCLWLIGNCPVQQWLCYIAKSKPKGWAPAQSAKKVLKEQVGEGAERAFVPHQNEVKLKH